MRIESSDYPNAPQNVLYTTHEAAARLRVSPRSLEGWRHRGGGPKYTKLGSRCLYREIDLDEWVASRVRTSTSDPGEGMEG